MTNFASACGGYEKSDLDSDAFLASLLVNVLGLAIPIAMLQIFDRVIPNESLPTLDALFLIMLVVVACDTLLKGLRGRIVLAHGCLGEHALSRRLLDRLFEGDLIELRRLGHDRLLEGLQAPPRLRILMSGQVKLQKIDLAFSVVYLGVVVVLGGVLVFVPIATIAAIWLTSRLVAPTFRHAIALHQDNGVARTSLLRDILNRARSVKLLSGESRLLTRYDGLQERASAAQCTLARVSDIAFATSAMAGQITTGLLSLFGGYLVIAGATDLANLAACIMLAGRSVQPFAQGFLAEGEVMQAREAARTIDGFLSVADAPQPGLAFGDKGVAVEARGLTWVEGAAAAGEQLDVSIRPGMLVTLGSACGDTASDVVRILAGERPAVTGSVRVNGRCPRPGVKPVEGDPAVLFVPKNPNFFQGSLRSNLTLFRQSEADAQFVSGLLDVHSEIDMMPDGIDWQHEGANRGGGSTGLRKKIALAAALAGDADVLFLDTPGAGLDPSSRRLMCDHLVMTKGIATVIVANAEPELVERSDLHVEFVDGAPPQLTYPTHEERLDDADMLWLSAMDGPEDGRKAS
ncbi:MAG: ABC transporter transmembrane domain-containing protein [Pseudomonadota bacterium]